jgi:hypothetical protein
MLEKIFSLLQQIQMQIDDIVTKMKTSANQIQVNTLSEIATSLGLIQAGEFRTGNSKEPGYGFSGMRMAYPFMTYNNSTWNLAGINNDDLQVGISAVDGKFYAADGQFFIDNLGLQNTGLTFPYLHVGNQPILEGGTRTRYFTMGYFSPYNSVYSDPPAFPRFLLHYYEPTSSFLALPNPSFELGTLAYWTASSSYFEVTNEPFSIGSWSVCFKEGGSASTLVSTKLDLTTTIRQNYEIYLWTKEYINASYTIKVNWYSITDKLLESNIICIDNQISSWNKRRTILFQPLDAVYLEIEIDAAEGSGSFFVDEIYICAIYNSNMLYFNPQATIEDNAKNIYRMPPPLAQVSVTNQSIANITLTTFSYTTEVKDTDDIWSSGTPTKLICQTAGLYKIFGTVHPASSAVGVRQVSIEHSSLGTLGTLADVILPATSVAVDNAPVISIEATRALNIADELTLQFYHSAGANLNTTAYFGMVYLGGES